MRTRTQPLDCFWKLCLFPKVLPFAGIRCSWDLSIWCAFEARETFSMCTEFSLSQPPKSSHSPRYFTIFKVGGGRGVRPELPDVHEVGLGPQRARPHVDNTSCPQRPGIIKEAIHFCNACCTAMVSSFWIYTRVSWYNCHFPVSRKPGS